VRYVLIPQDIKIRNRFSEATTGVPSVTENFSFLRYATVVWLDDARWQMPKSNMSSLIRVVREFEKEPGDIACIEDADWNILSSIINSPGMLQNNQGPALMRPLIQIQVGPPFEEAVLQASKTDPREASARPS
jgi:hypothetical protein